MMAFARNAGFTLIEVLVALVIVAFGVGALLTTLTSSADNLAYMRDRSFAQWIAQNRLAELRLSRVRPAVGHSHGEVEYAGARWRWDQEVIDPGIAGMMRVDVGVVRLDTDAVQGEEAPPALARVYGFLGEAVANASPREPEWSTQGMPPDPGGPSPGGSPPPGGTLAPGGGEPL